MGPLRSESAPFIVMNSFDMQYIYAIYILCSAGRGISERAAVMQRSRVGCAILESRYPVHQLDL
jgi:hypothetical protein